MGVHHFSTLSQQRLNPIKLLYDPGWMAGSILTASGAVPLTNCVSTLAIVVVGPTAMHNLPFSSPAVP